jgi:hypothetical protein
VLLRPIDPHIESREHLGSNPKPLVAALIVLALSFASTGCRSRAYRDVYAQKMASEIRVLEDQLYEADYENQVLRDELARAETRASQVVVPQTRRRTLLGRTLDESGNVIDLRTKPTEAEPPAIASPPDLDLPARPLPDGKLPDELQPLLDPPAESELDTKSDAIPNGRSSGSSANRADTESPYVPPAEAVPPSMELTVPDVELGEPVPPPANGVPETPPGQIELPDTAKKLGVGPPAEPVAIRINSSLSGGFKSDDQPAKEGVTVIIEAIDDKGMPVRLENFDIDANLSVVLLDPSRPGETARLGKWDFGPDDVRSMIHDQPTTSGQANSAIQVTIPWGDQKPDASKVIAHVRLSAAEALMQTQGEIATAQPSMAQWTPRSSLVAPPLTR